MQTIETKSGRLIRLPTEEEEAAIQRGIDSDPDNPEWTDEMFKESVPFSSLPEGLQTKLRSGRGPNKKPTKVQTAIRFDPEVLAALKSTGRGWQTRVNDVMKEWVAQHVPG
ncbi:MAG: BrnA antitoxin family protein [Betaproteobacteria bacterium]|nr:BrnA antitoxin family protein [Betaproteobacteria bacterium]